MILRGLGTIPIAALLLFAIIPYQTWSIFAGFFSAWHAHRIVLAGVCLIVPLALGLRMMGLPPAKTAVVLTIPVLGLLATFLHPVVFGVIVAVALFGAVIDRRRIYENANLALIVVGSVLFYGAAKPIVTYSLFRPQVVNVTPETPPIVSARGIELRRTPSIVHIVLDGYGSGRTLTDIYGHDTGPFFGALEQRGFRVFEHAVTPFTQTLPVMASIMSGGPIDVSEAHLPSRLMRSNLSHTIRSGPVPTILEAAGYTFARTESGIDFLDFEDVPVVTPPPPLSLSLLDAWLLREAASFTGEIHNRTLKTALTPGTLQELPQPFFYYQHLIAPHPPFTIAADGSPRETEVVSFNDGVGGGTEAERMDYIEGYGEKVRFIEDALLRQIDAMPEGPRIVVIHGDHGPGAFLNHAHAEHTCFSERLTTFVAIYSDDPGVAQAINAVHDRDFSLTNIYRVIFAALTDRDTPLLEPTASFLPWDELSRPLQVPVSELRRSCRS